MLQAFSGGVHPPENKETEKNTIEVMPAPAKVYIPFSQHLGKPAQPVVAVGDEVKINFTEECTSNCSLCAQYCAFGALTTF